MSDKDVWVDILYGHVGMAVRVAEADALAADRSSMVFGGLREEIDLALKKLGFSIEFERNKYRYPDDDQELRGYLRALRRRLHELQPLLEIIAPESNLPSFPSWACDD